ncbi:uncharacterized protein LOC110451862 [Mizuhopecten yessoensis]|uniref:uncharacterized protein LOC110451862 n=1 Tax=Mizuhopecten yessoensis TaxID=6573 RepID=UPI000B45A7C0|nr:uncharacterized protein LOC110451862 [Mizuhopecten yessoensis]
MVDQEHNEGVDLLYSISYFWLIPLCIFTTVFVGSVVSVLTGRPDPADVDVRYILPFFDYCCPCLPQRVRKMLYGGVRFEERKAWLKSRDQKHLSYDEITIKPTEEKLVGQATSHSTEPKLFYISANSTRELGEHNTSSQAEVNPVIDNTLPHSRTEQLHDNKYTDSTGEQLRDNKYINSTHF